MLADNWILIIFPVSLHYRIQLFRFKIFFSILFAKERKSQLFSWKVSKEEKTDYQFVDGLKNLKQLSVQESTLYKYLVFHIRLKLQSDTIVQKILLLVISENKVTFYRIKILS